MPPLNQPTSSLQTQSSIFLIVAHHRHKKFRRFFSELTNKITKANCAWVRLARPRGTPWITSERSFEKFRHWQMRHCEMSWKPKSWYCGFGSTSCTSARQVDCI